MILVPCPYCGPRNAAEFRWGGESQPRPLVATVTPEAWRSYLYLRRNPAGWTVESWYHRAGCRRYFRAERHTVTNEFRATYPPDTAERPERPSAAEPHTAAGENLG